MIRYVVEVHNGIEVHVCPVVNLFDKFGNEVATPYEAYSGVVQLPIGFITIDTNDIGTGIFPVQ